MSNPSDGISAATAEIMDDARAEFETQRVAVVEQIDWLAAPDAEDMLAARERLPANASALQVVNEARRVGRRPGSKNRAGKDFKRWIMSLGYSHPALALARIASSTPEVLIEASRKAGDGKRALTYHEASSLIVRSAGELLPYFEGKQASIDANGDVVSPLVIMGTTHNAQQVEDIIAAASVPLGDFDEAPE